MEKRYFPIGLVLCCLILGSIASKDISYNCPNPTGTIVSDCIKVSFDGDITLTNQDSYCYNVNLPKKFNKLPNVAVALNKFQAKQTKNLYLSIKPISSNNKANDGSISLTTITFSVNLYQQYTKWTLVEFFYLAEDRTDVEAGYKLIDAAVLSKCDSGKNMVAFLPFNSQIVGHVQTFTFLHGFEISSKGTSTLDKFSPLEVQILNKKINSTGISVSLSVTSFTQVYSVFVSFVVFQSNFGKVYGSNYVFQNYENFPTESVKSITHSPQVYIDQLWARIYGLSGFVINSNSFDISFETQDFKSIFKFKVNNFWKYFSYEYVFFLGGLCSDCTGYPIFYLGKCISECPSQTIFNGYTCIQCAQSQIWNGTHCISRCTAGKIWIDGTCLCPNNHQWNGYNCAPCASNKVWNPTTRVCTCPSLTVWNGFSCISCDGGRIYDVTSKSCICPSGLTWNGYQCLSVCPSNQIWNSQISQCQCPRNLIWNGQHCIECSGGRFYNPNTRQCECQQGYWNGYSCGTHCKNGMTWSLSNNRCECPKRFYLYNEVCIACGTIEGDSARSECRCPVASTYWNGYQCVLCDKERLFDPIMGTCQCPEPKKWNGKECVNFCPQGFQQVGKLCVCPSNTYELQGQCVPLNNCPNGMIWNSQSNKCEQIICQPGTYWNGQKCQSSNTKNCPFGTYWNGFSCVNYVDLCPQGTQWTGKYCQTVQKKCQPGMYWNGNACANIPSQCPDQLAWDNKQNRCVPVNNVCPSGTYYNGFYCLPYSQCKNNQIWSNNLAKCVCPDNSFWNGKQCVNCPQGMIYGITGCNCPAGSFYNGANCVKVVDCSSIPNSVKIGQTCQCIEGFDKVNGACVCNGILFAHNQCDKCTQKPYSKWNGYLCQCIDGYIEVLGKCKPKNQTQNPDGNSNQNNKVTCTVGTYFDVYEQKCLLCSDGCLSCKNCYDCQQCRPEYNYFAPSKSCIEICGDGKRFSLECDDGNNINGDGCSSDCKIQTGFTCNSGSPNSKDTCSKYKPQRIELIATGQTHLYGKIILNIKLNYLPTNLTTNVKQCNQLCDRILQIKLTEGQQTFTSISSQYIKGSSYSFSVVIDFGRQPIAQFTASVSINSQIKQKYFAGIETSSTLAVKVNPAFLALVETKANEDKLN